MHVRLEVVGGPAVGKVYDFDQPDRFLIGRDLDAHCRLPESDQQVSRRHCMLEIAGSQVQVYDLGSRNHTFVNEQDIGSEPRLLREGDVLRVGMTKIRVCLIADPEDIPTVERPSKLELVEDEQLFAPRPKTRDCVICSAPVSTINPYVCPGCLQQSESIQPQPVPHKYLCIRELGRGTMGRVWQAVHRQSGTVVALKTIHPQHTADQRQVERFLREANLLRVLNHHNIIAFRDMGDHRGELYFAMDFIRGKDLSKLLDKGRPLEQRLAVRLTTQVLYALQHAHEKGIVHRDIKPSNILLAADDPPRPVRVADFGLGRVYQSSQISGLTVTGDVGGTLAYMPPEQISQFRQAMPPADQYSTAAMLYQMLTGRYVYDLPKAIGQGFLMILNEPVVPIRRRNPNISEELAQVIHKALEREPKDRWPDVRAFRKALEPFGR
jgi:pSer/pThr/pTyr-binding forkhead associated (FHA) protein/predicted Ser/Thr protein kinase